METRASYVLVGVFLLGLISAGVVFVLWMAGQRDTVDDIALRIHFTGDVTGLTQGSNVRYRGIPVGKVTRVRIFPQNNDVIEVFIAVEEDTPIWTDTVARIETPGLTGSPFIQIFRPGRENRPRTGPEPVRLTVERLRDADPPYLIPGQPTELQRLFDELPKAVSSISKLARQATIMVDRASALLDDKNRKQFDQILTNFEVASSNAKAITENANRILGKDNQARIANMLKTADQAVGDLRSATREAKRIVDQDIGPAAKAIEPTIKSIEPAIKRITAAIGDVEKGAKSFSTMSEQITALVRENRQPIRTFTSTGLYEFNQFLADFRKLINSTERLVRRMENDPSSFFFGNRRGYSPNRR